MITVHMLNSSIYNIQILKHTETEHHSKDCFVKDYFTQSNLHHNCY